MVSTFPFLAERFCGSYWRSVQNVQIFDENILRCAIAEKHVTVEAAIIRALALALYLANTGFIAEARQACQKVIRAATKEGHDLSKMMYWDKIRNFAEQGAEDSVMIDSSREVKVEQGWDMKRWKEELFRNHAQLNRTTWRTRIDPLDTLRCASLFLVPTFGSSAPDTKDELEGLQVLKHFITIANGKPHLAYRRSQALAYAIDLAAKHERMSEAWDLALVAIEGPNYFFPGSEASFVLYPHFGPVFLQSCTQLNTDEVKKAISLIRELLHVNHAAAVLSRLDKHLCTRLDAAKKYPLPTMPPYAHLRELARVSRRAGEAFSLREGASSEAIAEAEKRIGYVLPDEYKTLMKIANGWEGDSAMLPGLARVEDVSFTRLASPTPITLISSPRNPYNQDATFTTALLISNASSRSQLYLVRDVDLKLDRNRTGSGRDAKRVKGNDGLPVDYENGDYRIVRVGPGDHVGYYSMIRSIIDHSIKTYDAAAGVSQRQESKSKIYRRKLPGVNEDNGQGDDDD